MNLQLLTVVFEFQSGPLLVKNKEILCRSSGGRFGGWPALFFTKT